MNVDDEQQYNEHLQGSQKEDYEGENYVESDFRPARIITLAMNVVYFIVLAIFNSTFLFHVGETQELLGNCYAKPFSTVPLFDGIKWQPGMLDKFPELDAKQNINHDKYDANQYTNITRMVQLCTTIEMVVILSHILPELLILFYSVKFE